MKLKYFKGSLILTVIGMILGYAIGFYYSGNVAGGLQAMFLVLILNVLEISLSFDNAVVNATVLKDMSPIWRQRFLTWGILIAVFGMRLVFPLLIVCLVAGVGPIEAIVLAATQPDKYAQIMLSAHTNVAAFGGMFLLMVSLKHFFDEEKEDFWLKWIERPLSKLGRLEAIEIAMSLLVLYIISLFVKAEEVQGFFVSGIFGLICYICVDALSAVLKIPEQGQVNIEKASVGMFLYLEVLDASFSFDGVVGAFALTNNLFLIMIGLGVGAMFVRSITIYLVDEGTLTQFKYLEAGAFYAIGSLAVIMLMNTFVHIPEVVTGLIGAVFIILSLISSIAENRKA